jgi:hypothetical protein
MQSLFTNQSWLTFQGTGWSSGWPSTQPVHSLRTDSPIAPMVSFARYDRYDQPVEGEKIEPATDSESDQHSALEGPMMEQPEKHATHDQNIHSVALSAPGQDILVSGGIALQKGRERGSTLSRVSSYLKKKLARNEMK